MPLVSTASPLPISAVVISFNEATRIGDCIAATRTLTDDVVVVDSLSHDDTVAIAEAAGARVVRQSWLGYSEQKNLGNAHARHDWILSLDADERVSPALAQAIRTEFAHGPRADAYEFRFRSYFGPRPVRFGAWNPEYHVRLFDRRKFSWNADAVHEGLRGEGVCRVVRLEGDVLHYTVSSRRELAGKMDRYSSLFATKARQRGKKPALCTVWLNPAYRFLRDYVLKLGVLDGRAGFTIAWEAARYTHLKYRKAQTSALRPAWADVFAAGATAMFAALLVLHSPKAPHPAAMTTAPALVAPSSSMVASVDDDENDADAHNPPPALVDDEILS